MRRAWRRWIIRKAAEIATEGNDYEHPWPLRPKARLYVDLETCFVNVYNQVMVGAASAETAVFIEARPGHEIEYMPIGTTRMKVEVKEREPAPHAEPGV